MPITLFKCQGLTSDGQFDAEVLINPLLITRIIPCENGTITIYFTDDEPIIISREDFNRLGVEID